MKSRVGDVFLLLPATLYRVARLPGRGQYFPGDGLNTGIRAEQVFSYSNLLNPFCLNKPEFGTASFSVVRRRP